MKPMMDPSDWEIVSMNGKIADLLKQWENRANNSSREDIERVIKTCIYELRNIYFGKK